MDRRAPPIILCGDRVGDQSCAGLGAGSDSETYILRKQDPARTGGEVSFFGEGGFGSGVLEQETPPLLPKLYGGSDDVPPHPEGLRKARCRREDGLLGGGPI